MKQRDSLERIVLFCAIALIFFSVGMGLAIQKWPPYGLFMGVRDTLSEMMRGPWLRDPKRAPRVYEGNGVVVNEPTRSSPGLTLVQGVFEDGPAIRIYTADGTVIRDWKLDFNAIWPNPVHIFPASNAPAGTFRFHTQGVVPEPDGSIVVNFAERGTAKYATCGGVDWTVDRMTHHSVTRNPDGTFWIPSKRDPKEIAPDYYLPGVSFANLMKSDNFYTDSALLVGPDGSVLRELPVLERIIDWIAETQQIEKFSHFQQGQLDFLHLNDIEVVTPELADRIDGVTAGDLLISLRNLNALAIVDATTGQAKWMTSGPWIRQHDPDVTPDGLITVFDNGSDQKLPGVKVPGSHVMLYDPSSDQAITLYPKTRDQSFFTSIMGTQQALPNGNFLITETKRGRVFEVTPDGEMVWSLVLASTNKTAAILESAIRLDPDQFPASTWACN